MERDISISEVAGRPGFCFRQGLFFLTFCAHWFHGESSLLSNGYRSLFPRAQSDRGVKLELCFHSPT